MSPLLPYLSSCGGSRLLPSSPLYPSPLYFVSVFAYWDSWLRGRRASIRDDMSAWRDVGEAGGNGRSKEGRRIARGMALLSKTVVIKRNNRVYLEAIGQVFMADEGGRLMIRRNENWRISNQSKKEKLESRKGRKGAGPSYESLFGNEPLMERSPGIVCHKSPPNQRSLCYDYLQMKAREG